MYSWSAGLIVHLDVSNRDACGAGSRKQELKGGPWPSQHLPLQILSKPTHEGRERVLSIKHLPHKHEDLSDPYNHIVSKCWEGTNKGNFWGLLASKLSQLMCSKFKEVPCLKKNMCMEEGNWRRHSILTSDPHTHVHRYRYKYIYICMHKKIYKAGLCAVGHVLPSLVNPRKRLHHGSIANCPL